MLSRAVSDCNSFSEDGVEMPKLDRPSIFLKTFYIIVHNSPDSLESPT